MSLGEIEREMYYRGEATLPKLKTLEDDLYGNELSANAGERHTKPDVDAGNDRGAGERRKAETARANLRIGRFRLFV
jgi:hypothetical protein